jgi:hypothetical protein
MRITGYRNRGVGAAAALVNAVTSTGGDDSDEALREVLADHGFVIGSFGPAAGEALRPWARALRPFFEAETLEAAADLLNGLLDEVSMHPHVSDHDGLGLHIHYAPMESGLADRVRSTALMDLSELLCEHGIGRVGVCAAPDCDRVYADGSRGGRRRFCCDACANRTNVAAFRARQRTP